MPTLKIEGLSRRHEGAERAALDRFDLEVEAGEVVVLVGPSGCGKSTALRLVAGLDEPTAGRVLLDGRDLARVPPQERDVAMVFQGYALYPHKTVAENMAFPLQMRGVPKMERRRKVEEAAELLGLGKLLDRRPDELSGGERQRVAMGRAIVRRPAIFLFDEPLSNLDAALRQTLRVEIARLLRSIGATAIYVTHDQIEAMTVGDRIVVMRAGAIEQCAAPRAIYERPASIFVAEFLGTPRVNVVRAPIDAGSARFGGAAIEVPPELEGRPRVAIAFRPEHVEVTPAGDAPPARALSFVAEAVVVEPLGAETVLHFEGPVEASAGVEAPGARHELRATVHGFSAVRRGDRVRLSVAREHLLWFDAETGRAIPTGVRA